MATTLHEVNGSTFEYGFEVTMKPADAAAILSVSTRTLVNYAKAGKIRSTRTEGGHRRYYADSIRAAHEGRWEDAAEPKDLDDVNIRDKGMFIPGNS